VHTPKKYVFHFNRTSTAVWLIAYSLVCVRLTCSFHIRVFHFKKLIFFFITDFSTNLPSISFSEPIQRTSRIIMQNNHTNFMGLLMTNCYGWLTFRTTLSEHPVFPFRTPCIFHYEHPVFLLTPEVRNEKVVRNVNFPLL
jgi:hypothetical protein